MRRADLALRAAKRRGRGLIKQFSLDMEGDFDERRFIKRELSRAMATRSFEVHYQPIVRADGGGIVGVEALLRWNHPNRGYIPPGLFIPVAEEAGLMDQLGAFVLRRALADAARWPGLYVAVNLSPVQVRDRRFIELVREVLTETKTDPARVVLEITEGVLIDDPLDRQGAAGGPAAHRRAARARRFRLRLFEPRLSAAASLRQAQDRPRLRRRARPVGEHRRDHPGDRDARARARHERADRGVETEEQRVLLRLAGCNEMQGFLFAKPNVAEEIDRILAAGGVLPQVAIKAAS